MTQLICRIGLLRPVEAHGTRIAPSDCPSDVTPPSLHAGKAREQCHNKSYFAKRNSVEVDPRAAQMPGRRKRTAWLSSRRFEGDLHAAAPPPRPFTAHWLKVLEQEEAMVPATTPRAQVITCRCMSDTHDAAPPTHPCSGKQGPSPPPPLPSQSINQSPVRPDSFPVAPTHPRRRSHSRCPSSIYVQTQGHALQHPVAGVLAAGQVRLEHGPASAHGVSARLGHIHGRPEGARQLQLGRLHRNNLRASAVKLRR